MRLLNQAGIEPLLLKGSIALLPGQYPHAFSRMLGDLDIAVAETELPTAVATLQSADFYPAPNIDPAHWSAADHHHWLPLFHPSGDGYVELHHRPLSARVPTAALSLPLMRTHAQPLDWDGVHLNIPTLEHRLLHNALHHQVQDRRRPGNCRHGAGATGWISSAPGFALTYPDLDTALALIAALPTLP